MRVIEWMHVGVPPSDLFKVRSYSTPSELRKIDVGGPLSFPQQHSTWNRVFFTPKPPAPPRAVLRRPFGSRAEDLPLATADQRAKKADFHRAFLVGRTQFTAETKIHDCPNHPCVKGIQSHAESLKRRHPMQRCWNWVSARFWEILDAGTGVCNADIPNNTLLHILFRNSCH